MIRMRWRCRARRAMGPPSASSSWRITSTSARSPSDAATTTPYADQTESVAMIDVEEPVPDGRCRQVLGRIARPPADHGRHRPDVGTGRLEQRRGDRHGLVSPPCHTKHDNVQSGDELSDELGHVLERHGRDRVERSVDVAGQRGERGVHCIHEKLQQGLRSDPRERPDAFGEQEEPEVVAPAVGDHGRERQRHRLCGLVASLLEVGLELVELGVEVVVIPTLRVAQRHPEKLLFGGADGAGRRAGQPAGSRVDRQRPPRLSSTSETQATQNMSASCQRAAADPMRTVSPRSRRIWRARRRTSAISRGREDPLDGVLPQLVGPEPAFVRPGTAREPSPSAGRCRPPRRRRLPLRWPIQSRARRGRAVLTARGSATGRRSPPRGTAAARRVEPTGPTVRVRAIRPTRRTRQDPRRAPRRAP